MKVEDCIFFQLAKASQAATRFWASKVAPLNVTAVQAMVLNALSEQDEVTSRDLGEKTRLDSATLTGILDRLESVALIERRSHPMDRRAILVCLTEQGSKLAIDLKRIMHEANREYLSGLSDEEQVILRNVLRKVRER